jgi:hypothetical protein
MTARDGAGSLETSKSPALAGSSASSSAADASSSWSRLKACSSDLLFFVFGFVRWELPPPSPSRRRRRLDYYSPPQLFAVDARDLMRLVHGKRLLEHGGWRVRVSLSLSTREQKAGILNPRMWACTPRVLCNTNYGTRALLGVLHNAECVVLCFLACAINGKTKALSPFRQQKHTHTLEKRQHTRCLS